MMGKDMKEIKKIYLRKYKKERYLADNTGTIIIKNLTNEQIQDVKKYLTKKV